MSGIYIVSDNILSPIGLTTAENFQGLTQGVSGIKEHYNTNIADQPFYAALFGEEAFAGNADYTKFENLLIASISNALKSSSVKASDKKTILIISSTKGNISMLENEAVTPALQKRMALTTSANLIAKHIGFVNQPVIVSNACISGIMATLTGMRLIASGQYENAIIAGADVLTKFILSGFQSFQAISPTPCKPFDLNRDGITLGEGAATIILSAQKNKPTDIKVMGGAVSNDANHISAPSRTGMELSQAINKTLQQAKLTPAQIDFVSAHGTATIYNDEMEAKAIALSQLQTVPVNSLKGYYGHTLGAAGLIESIIAIQSLKENLMIPTIGFNELGVSFSIKVCDTLLPGAYKNCLKTASGFGGCNAAIVFGKD